MGVVHVRPCDGRLVLFDLGVRGGREGSGCEKGRWEEEERWGKGARVRTYRCATSISTAGFFGGAVGVCAAGCVLRDAEGCVG